MATPSVTSVSSVAVRSIGRDEGQSSLTGEQVDTTVAVLKDAASYDDDSVDVFEKVDSEIDDDRAVLPTYEILTYPADYTLEVIVDKWRNKEIVIPGFQRGFVWTQKQASRLIDSFLIGLPVPSIFLFGDLNTNELLVVDGQQRIKAISYFFEGYFGDEQTGRRRVFRLTGLEEGSPFEGLDYEDLQQQNPSACTKLKNSVLRSFIIRQLDPNDDTSIYHVFERLNTGGTSLQTQEIRNCIYHGPFNDMLKELNDFESWRKILGKQKIDNRQRDIESILRFLALVECSSSYEKPMKKFLNDFMRNERNSAQDRLDYFKGIFRDTADLVYSELGDKPFNIRHSGMNKAVFDSVFVAVSRYVTDSQCIDSRMYNIKDSYDKLITDSDYLDLVNDRTTDKSVVHKRIQKASEAFMPSNE